MTTEALELVVELEELLPWDTFLDRKVVQMTDQQAQNLQEHIERYRTYEWPKIVSELEREHKVRLNGDSQSRNIRLSNDREPHWVEPGAAYWWQEQVVRERGTDDDGRPVIKERSLGWSPCGPITCSDASLVRLYLENGLRFRPPGPYGPDVVDVEVSEPASPPEAQTAFECRRQGDVRGFLNWKAYIQHCVRYNEPPEHPLPEDVRKRAETFAYYCYLHNVGWSEKQKRAVIQHIRHHPLVQKVHPRLETMLMKKPKEKLVS